MRPTGTRSSIGAALWLVSILILLALRLPAFVEPAGNDQSLYMYVADRVREGAVPYVDAWEQKPPAVFFVYAALRSVWPTESAVAMGDLIAAALVAGLLIDLGRRTIGGHGGYVAAFTFLLFGHPSIARLSGIYVRGQCEVFIALAATAALWLAWRDQKRPHHLVLAGVWLGIAFWLKYNALAYALPVAVAMAVTTGSRVTAAWRDVLAGLGWLAAGVLLVSAIALAYFASHGALEALRVATIDYNLRYSGETYRSGVAGAVAYLLSLPFDHAKTEMIWFLGGVGVMLLLVTGRSSTRPLTAVMLAWLAATIVSIAVNGARNLPQYFVQAGPALALAFAAGSVQAARRGRTWQGVVLLLVVAGLWKVGTEGPAIAGLRWGGLPQLADNIAFDVDYARGRMDRQTYLARFRGGQKYDAAAVDDLAGYVARVTTKDDRILVFGFAPAVYLESQRPSASRFFWSRPVVLEFAGDRPGYGSRGLLADLSRSMPAVVALQKVDWQPEAPNSEAFFLATPALHDWLAAGYFLDHDTPVFSVWRKRL